jgi:hypothetical protein
MKKQYQRWAAYASAALRVTGQKPNYNLLSSFKGSPGLVRANAHPPLEGNE